MRKEQGIPVTDLARSQKAGNHSVINVCNHMSEDSQSKTEKSVFLLNLDVVIAPGEEMGKCTHLSQPRFGLNQ